MSSRMYRFIGGNSRMNKLGTYISQLMKTIVDKEQDGFVKELALSELRRLNVDIESFLNKHQPNDEKASEVTVKQLLQEDKKDVKDK